jgi:lysophospholipase L1-like esterase
MLVNTNSCYPFSFFLSCMIVVSHLIASHPLAANPESLRIVAFGDSTTAERAVDGKPLRVYAAILAEDSRLRDLGVQVINAGAASNTTFDARRRFSREVLEREPDLVILQFGINDAMVDVWNDPPATAPRVSLADYAGHLAWMAAELQKRGVQPVLMTPNPIAWTDRMRSLYGKSPYDPEDPEGFNVLLKGYAEAVRQVAKQADAPLVDVHAAFQDHSRHGPLEELLLDGMHPNEKGHRLIATLLRERILRMQEEPSPSDPASESGRTTGRTALDSP